MSIVRNTDNVIESTFIDEEGIAINIDLFTDIHLHLYAKPKNILQTWKKSENQITKTALNICEVYVDRENMKRAIKCQLYVEVVVFSADVRFSGDVMRQSSPDNELTELIDSPTARP